MQLSNDLLPSQGRFALALPEWDVRIESADGLEDDVSVRTLPLGEVACFKARPFVCRKRDDAAKRGIFVYYPKTGRASVSHGGKHLAALSGTAVAWPAIKGCVIEHRSQQLTCVGVLLYVNDPALALSLDDGPVALSGSGSIAVTSCLELFLGDLKKMSDKAFAMALDASRGVLGLALDRDLDQPSTHFSRIQLAIEQHLQESSLTPALVANRVGMSTRYVHKLFSQQGCTFSHYVRRMRLERIAHDLIDKTFAGEPIALIANRWGYCDISTFNRHFKAWYGRTPRQTRRTSS